MCKCKGTFQAQYPLIFASVYAQIRYAYTSIYVDVSPPFCNTQMARYICHSKTFFFLYLVMYLGSYLQFVVNIDLPHSGLRPSFLKDHKYCSDVLISQDFKSGTNARIQSDTPIQIRGKGTQKIDVLTSDGLQVFDAPSPPPFFQTLPTILHITLSSVYLTLPDKSLQKLVVHLSQATVILRPLRYSIAL